MVQLALSNLAVQAILSLEVYSVALGRRDILEIILAIQLFDVYCVALRPSDV